MKLQEVMKQELQIMPFYDHNNATDIDVHVDRLLDAITRSIEASTPMTRICKYSKPGFDIFPGDIPIIIASAVAFTYIQMLSQIVIFLPQYFVVTLKLPGFVASPHPGRAGGFLILSEFLLFILLVLCSSSVQS